MDDAPVAVEGDDHDGQRGQVDGEAGRRLDGAAEVGAALAEGPVLGQHVHRRQHHRETENWRRGKGKSMNNEARRQAIASVDQVDYVW